MELSPDAKITKQFFQANCLIYSLFSLVNSVIFPPSPLSWGFPSLKTLCLLDDMITLAGTTLETDVKSKIVDAQSLTSSLSMFRDILLWTNARMFAQRTQTLVEIFQLTLPDRNPACHLPDSSATELNGKWKESEGSLPKHTSNPS